MSSLPALDVLREAASSLARGGDLETTLLDMLRPLADQSGIDSAAVFVVTAPGPALAHDVPTDDDTRAFLGVVADLVAVAVDRSRTASGAR